VAESQSNYSRAARRQHRHQKFQRTPEKVADGEEEPKAIVKRFNETVKEAFYS
jgi:hypothetical protein